MWRNSIKTSVNVWQRLIARIIIIMYSQCSQILALDRQQKRGLILQKRTSGRYSGYLISIYYWKLRHFPHSDPFLCSNFSNFMANAMKNIFAHKIEYKLLSFGEFMAKLINCINNTINSYKELMVWSLIFCSQVKPFD